MAKANSAKSIRDIFTRISKVVEAAAKPSELRPVGIFASDLIVKRTRLGYGVDRQFGNKQRLKPLSRQYVEKRRTLSDLSDFTSAKRSNLTLSGQLLDSMTIISSKPGSVKLGPAGNHRSGISNASLADKLAKGGRVFNRISDLEYKQILRFYRRNFGDLLRKSKLLS